MWYGISSNGNLFIIEEVNLGAIISAKKNIYICSKLISIRFAGNGEYSNASIWSLYLNSFQLMIADVIAIGSKENPKNYYLKFAVIDKQIKNIKPYLIETKLINHLK